MSITQNPDHNRCTIVSGSFGKLTGEFNTSITLQTFAEFLSCIRFRKILPRLPSPSLLLSRRAFLSQTDGVSSTSASVATGSTPSNTPQSRNAILVSNIQKGNPLLKHIRNVKWVFSDIIPDYLLGQNSCALYLSLRYHLLHPEYLYFRISELQNNFKLCVVMCHVDVEDTVKPLLEVTKTSLLDDCTLLCAWSLTECARYLETIKVYENKPADLIQGQMDTDYISRLNHSLTSVRHVNKSDVVTLGSTFGIELNNIELYGKMYDIL